MMTPEFKRLLVVVLVLVVLTQGILLLDRAF
jgi:hypothetical protein